MTFEMQKSARSPLATLLQGGTTCTWTSSTPGRDSTSRLFVILCHIGRLDLLVTKSNKSLCKLKRSSLSCPNDGGPKFWSSGSRVSQLHFLDCILGMIFAHFSLCKALCHAGGKCRRSWIIAVWSFTCIGRWFADFFYNKNPVEMNLFTEHTNSDLQGTCFARFTVYLALNQDTGRVGWATSKPTEVNRLLLSPPDVSHTQKGLLEFNIHTMFRNFWQTKQSKLFY